MKRLLNILLFMCLAHVATAQQKPVYELTMIDTDTIALIYLPRVNDGIRIKGGSASSAALGRNHLVIKGDTAGLAARIHFEPNGYFDGVQSKTDYMGVPFDDSNTGYNLGNLFFKKGDFSGAFGTNGIFFIGAKSSLKEAPIYPSINFGFNDDNANAVPMKLFYIDHTQTQFYTPMTGMWRTGKAYTSGQYITDGTNIYLAASSGTSGATEPTHTSGTVSDGGVSWAYIRAYSNTSTNVKPVVIFGNRADMPKFGNPSVRVQYAQPTLTWKGVKHNFLNSTDGLQYSLGTETNDFFIRNIISGSYFKMLSAGGFLFSGVVTLSPSITGAGAGTQALVLTNTPTSGTTTFPAGNYTVVGTNTSQVLTDKTLATPILTSYTVATLPTGSLGMTAVVTDALSPAIGSVVASGGSAKAMLWFNGTAWTVTGI